MRPGGHSVTIGTLESGWFTRVRPGGRAKVAFVTSSAAQVCIVSNFVGSGMKIKLVEAMSYGRACVSTRTGHQGLMDAAEKAVLLADTGEEFAAAVCGILTHPQGRQAMEHEARRYVAEKLSPEAVCQPFVERVLRHVETRFVRP